MYDDQGAYRATSQIELKLHFVDSYLVVVLPILLGQPEIWLHWQLNWHGRWAAEQERKDRPTDRGEGGARGGICCAAAAPLPDR